MDSIQVLLTFEIISLSMQIDNMQLSITILREELHTANQTILALRIELERRPYNVPGSPAAGPFHPGSPFTMPRLSEQEMNALAADK
jgi:hypothetical protein